MLAAIRQAITANLTPEAPLIVALCGAADLGKSHISQSLVDQLSAGGCSAAHLPLDAYLIDRAQRLKRGISGYQPQSYDLAKVEQDLRSYKCGKAIGYHPYDHALGKTEKSTTNRAAPSCVLILDGLHSMHQRLLPLLSLSIFVYTDDASLKKIRHQANLHKRQQTIEQSQALAELEFASYKGHIELYKEQADILLRLTHKWHYDLERKSN